MDSTKAKIAKLLASGATQAQTARAVGVTESYITQLISEDAAFTEVYAELCSAKLEEEVTLEDSYKKVEQSILTELNNQVGTADMSELSKALQAVTQNKTRGNRLNRDSSDGSVAVAVSVHLQQHVANAFVSETNARNEIITLNGRNMIGLTEEGFNANLSKVKNIITLEGDNHAKAESQSNTELGKRLEEIELITGGL